MYDRLDTGLYFFSCNSSPAVFNNGHNMVSLRLLVKFPVARGLFIISNILRAKISAYAFMMAIGIGSNLQLLEGAALISFRMSSLVVAVISMK